MEYGWDLIWDLYRKSAPSISGLNTFLYGGVTTLYIIPNEEIGVFYPRTLGIKKDIDISKAIISPNILIKIYLEFLIYCPDISNFLTAKHDYFTILLSTLGNHVIYKADTIAKITEFIEHCNVPVILNLYVQSSHPSQRSLIAGTQYKPISSEDQLNQPTKHTDVEYPCVNMTASLCNVGIPETDFDPVISYMINLNTNYTLLDTTETTFHSDYLYPHIKVFSGGYDH